MDWVDRIKIDSHMKDALFTSNVDIVLTVPGRIWLIKLRREHPLTCEVWKKAMIHKFGTETWRNNMPRDFDEDRFKTMITRELAQWLCN